MSSHSLSPLATPCDLEALSPCENKLSLMCLDNVWRTHIVCVQNFVHDVRVPRLQASTTCVRKKDKYWNAQMNREAETYLENTISFPLMEWL